MAYKVIRSAKDDYQIGREITAVLDRDADLEDLIAGEGTLAPGSIAIVADAGMPTYILNASGEWKSADSSSGGGGGAVLGSLILSLSPGAGTRVEAGSIEYPDIDGWDLVQIDVAPIVTETLSVSENGSYSPEPGVDGYSSVEVDVPTIPQKYVQITVSTASLSSPLSNPAVSPLTSDTQEIQTEISTQGLVNTLSGQGAGISGIMTLTFGEMGQQRVPFAAYIQPSQAPSWFLTGGASSSGSSIAVYFEATVNNSDELAFTKLIIVQNGVEQDMTAVAGQLVSNLTLSLYDDTSYV